VSDSLRLPRRCLLLRAAVTCHAADYNNVSDLPGQLPAPLRVRGWAPWCMSFLPCLTRMPGPAPRPAHPAACGTCARGRLRDRWTAAAARSRA
jgi:hypothetical protein